MVKTKKKVAAKGTAVKHASCVLLEHMGDKKWPVQELSLRAMNRPGPTTIMLRYLARLGHVKQLANGEWKRTAQGKAAAKV